MSKKIEAKLQVKLKRELNDGEQLTDRELFRDYITRLYEPYGPRAMMVMKSSLELIHDCREVCSPTFSDVASVMEELKFQTDSLVGTVVWIMHETTDLKFY
ncbi:MAG: hypothetical protein IJ290_04130 [Bacteroidaceae bacterium]|nr:hypothetical protein [Bacteroidaceae bacterium]